MNALFTLIDLVLGALIWMIIIWAIMSWLIVFNVVRGFHPVVQSFMISIGNLLEPLLRPIRRILPPMAGVDFSPMVLLILLYVIRVFLLYDVLAPMMRSGGGT